MGNSAGSASEEAGAPGGQSPRGASSCHHEDRHVVACGSGPLVFPEQASADHAEVAVEQDDALRVMEAYQAASKNTLADPLGSLSSGMHAAPDQITVGVEINATHHRAATDGLVTGVTTLQYGGRTITTHEIVITNEAGRRVCTSRLTCMLMDRVPNRVPRAVSGSDPA